MWYLKRDFRWLAGLSFVFLAGAVFIAGAFSSVSADEAETVIAQVAQKDVPEKSIIKGANQDDEYLKLMRVFADTFEQIESNYVTDVERRELLEAAIRGMLTKLDPYSNYISPKQLARFDQDINQEFGGIGIQVNHDPARRQIVVISPMPGTPAYKAGIIAGDRIVSIDGKLVKDFPKGDEINEAVRLLKGKPGEKVKIGIARSGEKEILKIDVARAIIQVATVMGDHYNDDGTWDFMIDKENKVGYIRLTHFTKNSTREMKDALEKLSDQGMKGLILDLRFNPGGLLSAAADISDMFIESGKIVSTKGRKTRERVWRAHKRGTLPSFPMAILVNHSSASASEIVSACLQDHKRAIVIGERSWGKGSVQNVIPLEKGVSALKLTIASYHRPSGKNIHRFPGAKKEDEWGVMPNKGYVVKLNRKQVLSYLRYRRERDVLKPGGPPKSNFTDAQLEKAKATVLKSLTKEGAPEKAVPEKAAPKVKQPAQAQSSVPTGAKTGAKTGKSSVKKSSASLPRFLIVPRREMI